MLKLILPIGMILLASATYGQKLAEQALPHEPALLKDANPSNTNKGTYQVILQDQRMVEPEITPGILSLIQSNRKQNEVTYVVIDAYTTIKVLPYNEINKPSFEPVKTYVYEN